MIVLPAIDIKDGRCVRLYQGEFSTVHRVAEDPVETALGFKKQGAVWLHMVDLDGALKGQRINAQLITDTAQKSGLKVELGGGIRTVADAEYYLSRGISRVIVGSAAIENPDLVGQIIAAFGEDSVAVGIDARGRTVATRGWLDSSGVDYIDLARRMEQIGVKYIIFTDISKDGTLAGPPLERLSELCGSVSCSIIASGGVGSLGDIISLKALGVYGAICGKAVYTGDLALDLAIKEAGLQTC